MFLLVDVGVQFSRHTQRLLAQENTHSKPTNDFPGRSKFVIAQVMKNILDLDYLSLLSSLRILICGSEALWRLDKQYPELPITGP